MCSYTIVVSRPRQDAQVQTTMNLCQQETEGLMTMQIIMIAWVPDPSIG